MSVPSTTIFFVCPVPVGDNATCGRVIGEFDGTDWREGPGGFVAPAWDSGDGSRVQTYDAFCDLHGVVGTFDLDQRAGRYAALI